ncbi:hypothetical protein AAC387_Pa09g0314 [Persea americana]
MRSAAVFPSFSTFHRPISDKRIRLSVIRALNGFEAKTQIQWIFALASTTSVTVSEDDVSVSRVLEVVEG